MNPDVEQILAGIDDKIQKAVISTTYTMAPPTRSIYSPENLDPTIKHVIPTSFPVLNLLSRDKGYGQVATWRKLTSRLDNQAGGTGTTTGFVDAGQPSQTTQTYVLATAPYKNLGRDVEIGRQAIASNRGGNLEDIRAHEEMVKTLEVKLSEENYIMNGDSAADATVFDGFAKSFTTNSGTASFLTASGIGNYCTTLFTAGSENPTHIIYSPRQGQALVDDLQRSGAIQRIAVTPEGAVGGAHLRSVINPNTGNEIQTIVSRYTGGGGNGWAYLITKESPAGEQWLAMDDLEPVSLYDVPTANHSVVSRVFETTVLKVIADVFQYKVGGLQ